MGRSTDRLVAPETRSAVPVLPGAEPFAADGGTIGVVLSHGFTGTTQSLRPWAEHLAAAGCTVRLPRLPGHGTNWRELNATRWTDWYAEIERAYVEVATQCDHVFVGGLSMGGALVTRLAEEKGDAISGLVLVNPSYATERRLAPLAKYLAPIVKSQPAIGNDIKRTGPVELAYDRTPVAAFASLQQLWKITLADLARISAPILMFRSRVDHVVEPRSGRLLVAGATSTTVREIVLEDSYHVATLDNDAQTIFDTTWTFIHEHASPVTS
jgi:carboxylesterase